MRLQQQIKKKPSILTFIKNLLDVEQENMKQLIIMIKKNTKKDKNKG